MKRFNNRLIIVISGVLILLASTLIIDLTPAKAADTIKLTFNGLWPPNHPMSKGAAAWMEKIEKDTQGRVKFQPFWAGALYRSKQSALELGKGLADTGEFSGGYAPTGFEFEKAMRLSFWGVRDRILARKVYNEVNARFPELEKQFTDSNIVIMGYASIPPYHAIFAKKTVRNVGDFKGLSIKSVGDYNLLAKELGADGINLPMSECYAAMQKGTIDGIFAPYETLKSFNFAEIVKCVVNLNIAPAPAGHWGFCKKSWDNLPKDIQKIFLDNQEWFGNKLEEELFNTDAMGLKLAKEQGVEIIDLFPGDLNKIYEITDRIVLEQMKVLDSKGLPGTAVYKEMRGLIDQYSK